MMIATIYLVSLNLLCASVHSFLISNHPIPRRTRTSISIITYSKLHSSSTPSKPQKRQSKKEEKYQYQYKINYENSEHHPKDTKDSGESTFPPSTHKHGRKEKRTQQIDNEGGKQTDRHRMT